MHTSRYPITLLRHKTFPSSRKMPCASVRPQPPHHRGSHCSDFFQQRLVLPVLKCYRKGIIQYVLYCVLPSFTRHSVWLFIHAVAHARAWFLLRVEQYSVVWIWHRFSTYFLLSDTWIVSSLELSWIQLLQTFLYKSFCERVFPFPLENHAFNSCSVITSINIY